jgi:hypothetical protein
MSEIRPVFEDGKARCSRFECPVYPCEPYIGYSDNTLVCEPWYIAKIKELQQALHWHEWAEHGKLKEEIRRLKEKNELFIDQLLEYEDWSD